MGIVKRIAQTTQKTKRKMYLSEFCESDLNLHGNFLFPVKPAKQKHEAEGVPYWKFDK